MSTQFYPFVLVKVILIKLTNYFFLTRKKLLLSQSMQRNGKRMPRWTCMSFVPRTYLVLTMSKYLHQIFFVFCCVVILQAVVLGIMPAKSKSASASTNSNGGEFVRMTLADSQGRVFVNLLVWNGSFTSAHELCDSETFLRGSVSSCNLFLVKPLILILGDFDSH